MRPSRRQGVALVAGCAALAAVIVVAVLATGDNSTNKTNAARSASPGSHSSGSPVVLRALPGSAYNTAPDNILNPSTKTGGTLRLLSGSDCDSWDPARVTFDWCWNLQRLITRTLVGYANVNSLLQLGPDLATSLGRHNADYTRWTYTLKQGLASSDGRPITPSDVKRGIDRLAADNAVRADIDSIVTTGDSITFNLSKPNAEFDYLMTMPSSSPVPAGSQPVASGPFEIGSYQPKKSIVFVRNPHWRQATDTIRHPLVSSVRLRVDAHLADIDRQLRAGQADARADGGVQAAFRSQILTNPVLKQNADDPALPVTQYMAVTPSVIPNIHCRRAIFDAWDKAAALRIYGGRTGGKLAGSMTPPRLDGHDQSLDPYSSGPRWTGNVAKARAELRLCGQPNGFSTKMVYDLLSKTDPKLFAAERAALGRVGITLIRWKLPLTGTFVFTGSPQQLKEFGIGLAENSGPPDYSTAYALYKPLAYRPNALPDGLVFSLYTDPAVQRILDGRPKSIMAWTNLDRAVMDSALYLPVMWPKVLEYRNPRMTNVTCDLALASGIYDFVNVGVR